MSDNESSKKELTLEGYIPYSKRHPENIQDDKFGRLCDHLERVIGIDMDGASIMDGELDGRKTKFIVLPNGKVLMVNEEVASLSDTYESDGPKGIFFVMLSNAFFGTYQTVFPYFRSELILNNSLGVK